MCREGLLDPFRRCFGLFGEHSAVEGFVLGLLLVILGVELDELSQHSCQFGLNTLSAAVSGVLLYVVYACIVSKCQNTRTHYHTNAQQRKRFLRFVCIQFRWGHCCCWRAWACFQRLRRRGAFAGCDEGTSAGCPLSVCLWPCCRRAARREPALTECWCFHLGYSARQLKEENTVSLPTTDVTVLHIPRARGIGPFHSVVAQRLASFYSTNGRHSCLVGDDDLVRARDWPWSCTQCKNVKM